ncbi:MAG: type I methionyl aminopeptidase [Gemmataceae bacterium]|nr:type I methionyl aminopeptidase [Gemmataceae bacterium]
MIIRKSNAEIEIMDRCNRLVWEILRELADMAKPGVRTRELDSHAERRARAAGARPAFKGYRGFPASLCVSVNDEIVHGIPSERRLQEGDIVSLDFGVCKEGYYGDAALTVPVGEVSPEARRLLSVTREALGRAIQAARPGAHLGDISWEVQDHVERHGFSVVREFVGHGIGGALHEEPQVPNFGKPGLGPRLETGMVLAIEPMVNAGAPEVVIDNDQWTARTADHSLSAHFERSVAVTQGGPLVLGDPEAASA